MAYQNTRLTQPPRPKLEIVRKGERMKTPMPKWSHQHDLNSMLGTDITLIFGPINDFVTGTLLSADAFTIQLAHDTKSVMTYFKHAIRGFQLKA